jgi:hypothetical protein
VVEYQGTTTQLCGLYPFVAGSGAPSIGVPVGRHLLWGQVVCLDPLVWLRGGLVANPGMFVLGQPGAGKSALVKRLVTGMVACGTTALILGDTKPDYTALVAHLGGQTIHIGRGRDRINPLDTGPVGVALRRLGVRAAQTARLEIRGRRLALLLALCALVRGRTLNNAEEVILGRAVDITTDQVGGVDPTIPDILTLIENGNDELRRAARAAGVDEYRRRVEDLVPTLALLCEGSLAGVFDGPTTTPIDLNSGAVSVDISRVAAAGDQLVAAAMLCVWAYGYGLVDATTALADHPLTGTGHTDTAHPDTAPPRRQYLAVMDELWRALRGCAGLVEHADALTRLNRAKGIASVMVTHSMADLNALPTVEDRAKACGFIERAAIKVLAGLPPSELDRVNTVVRLGDAERALVSSWAAPAGWTVGTVHPGRGKYLIKTGDRPGLPIAMSLVAEEQRLYDTDHAIREAGH